MKPHEEQWEYDRVIRVLRTPDSDDNKRDGRGILASAAPDMVRALLNIYRWCEEGRGGTDMPGGHQREVISALRKAGVIL